MVWKAAVVDRSEKTRPYADRGWQYEIRNPAVARDEMPHEEEGKCRDKDWGESFGHVLNREARGDREDSFSHRRFVCVRATSMPSLRSARNTK